MSNSLTGFLVFVSISLVLRSGVSPVMATPSTVLTLSPDKRLKAAISQDSMNRLTVANDRITQVFGDEESYVLQSEDHTGQIFLKPTADNGDKPLSITLITENGVTQDLTLEPTQRGATTLILKPTPGSFSPSHGSGEGEGGGRQTAGKGRGNRAPYAPSDEPRDSGREEGESFGHSLPGQVVQAVKYVVTGQGVVVSETEGTQRQAPEGFNLTFKQAYQVGNWKGLQFDVINTTETAIEIEEKSFFRPGDLALTFTNRVLPPQGTTLLTVVSR